MLGEKLVEGRWQDFFNENPFHPEHGLRVSRHQSTGPSFSRWTKTIR
jgi:hypothetical protein